MAGYGDEGAGEFPCQSLHESCFTAAGWSLEQDGQSVVECGPGDKQFIRLLQIKWHFRYKIILHDGVFHVVRFSLL